MYTKISNISENKGSSMVQTLFSGPNAEGWFRSAANTCRVYQTKVTVRVFRQVLPWELRFSALLRSE
jgi:hypothetical protein